jgi:rhomboid protease GluP
MGRQLKVANMSPLFSKLSEETVHIYSLVLTASDIAHQVVPRGHFWSIAVPVLYRSAACEAIAKYLKENRLDLSYGGFPPFPKGERTYSALYALVPLVLIHMAVRPGAEARVFVESLGADAGRIVSGDLYRCLTALLLHANWAHLLGNVVALALFGTALAAAAGWGVGWLLILLCGAGGNYLAALWYGPGHVSVGASTAVFAAVGLCAAFSFWRGGRVGTWSWRRWAPLAGGLALLGFLGAAAHTDLVAHMMGFAVGMVTGLLWGWQRRSVVWPIQLAAALLAAGLVVVSWLKGLNYNG